MSSNKDKQRIKMYDSILGELGDMINSDEEVSDAFENLCNKISKAKNKKKKFNKNVNDNDRQNDNVIVEFYGDEVAHEILNKIITSKSKEERMKMLSNMEIRVNKEIYPYKKNRKFGTDYKCRVDIVYENDKRD